MNGIPGVLLSPCGEVKKSIRSEGPCCNSLAVIANEGVETACIVLLYGIRFFGLPRNDRRANKNAALRSAGAWHSEQRAALNTGTNPRAYTADRACRMDFYLRLP
jgi:hypothetical protein